jgi:predicted Zn-dependent protease
MLVGFAAVAAGAALADESVALIPAAPESPAARAESKRLVRLARPDADAISRLEAATVADPSNLDAWDRLAQALWERPDRAGSQRSGQRWAGCCRCC